MRTDFALFRKRLAEACRARDVTAAKLSLSTGLAPRRTIAHRVAGPHALGLYRACQISGVPDLSTGWLLDH